MINLNVNTSKVDCTNIENYEYWIASSASKDLEEAYINTYHDNKANKANKANKTNSHDVFAHLKSKYDYK